MIRAVIFDLDGTLLDTLGDIAAAHNRSLRFFGFPERDLSEFRHIIGAGLGEAVKRAAPPGTAPDILEKLFYMYEENYFPHMTELTEVYEGLHEVLSAFEKARVRVAVITNKLEGSAKALVSHYFPETKFEFVWGNDKVRPLKPSPEAGRAAAEYLGLEPQEIAFVGDSDADMLFAVNSGFYGVGSVWGYRGAKELGDCGASLLAYEPTDLLKLI